MPASKARAGLHRSTHARPLPAGNTFVQYISITSGKRVQWWRGANASQANDETLQIQLQCSNSANATYSWSYPVNFNLQTPNDANWPEWQSLYSQDTTVSSSQFYNVSTYSGISEIAVA